MNLILTDFARRYLEDHAAALQKENQSLQQALVEARRTSTSGGSTWEAASTIPIESDDQDAAIGPFPDLRISGSFDDADDLWDTTLLFGRSHTNPSAKKGKEGAPSSYSSRPYENSPNGHALASITPDVFVSTPPPLGQGSTNRRTRGDYITDAAEHFLQNCLTKSSIDYLIGLFFTRCMVMMKFVPPSQFLTSEDSDTPSRKPSSLLLAIIAAALRYATRPDVLAACFDKDGNNVPAALAKKLLETELLDADINTVHALLTISEVETSSNNLMSGYMHGSMAIRLLFNLRLHYGSGVEASLSREEALARYWLLWNLSVQDQSCKLIQASYQPCD
jgi:hypothetical protein